MARYFQAIALDYDGTLVDGPGPPSIELLSEIRLLREAGCKVILATGRILADLRRVFPGVDTHFDAIVAENGAVVVVGASTKRLASPTPSALFDALVELGLPVTRGEVVIETDAVHDSVVLAAIARLGLELRLVRNRSRLMVLPATASKGQGVFDVLGELRVSHHSLLAIGDAENDHSLLDVAEVGVAVGNAIESLKRAADVVLDLPAGEGVRAFLRASVRNGELRLVPRRWSVRVGTSTAGEPVMLPGSRTNVLVAGGSGSGKSYFAGLFAERLIGAGYSVVVLDPEGDHDDLASMRGVIHLGCPDPLPPPEQLSALLNHRFASVVCDLSLLSGHEKRDWLRRAVAELDGARKRNGLPHWIVLDEAQLPLSGQSATAGLDPDARGWCFVSWRAAELAPAALASLDYLVFTGGDLPTIDPGFPIAALREASADGRHGIASMARRGDERVTRFHFDARMCGHVRHWNKYARSAVPPHHRFHFRGSGGNPTGMVAANLAEFHRELQRSASAVVAHHAANRDFSRWLAEVVQDAELAARVRELERRAARSDELEPARQAILNAIHHRYLD